MAMTSRERLLGTMAGACTGYTPLCFLLLSELRRQCADELEFAQRQVELGLDATVPLPDLPFEFHPAVETEVWLEPASPNSLLHKVYHTPAGDLETVVEKTPDWPHGDDIPVQSDFVIPRARKFLVTEPADLGPLAYLLPDADAGAVAEFRRGAAEAQRFAEARGLATRAGFFRLSDFICWLCGCEQFAMMGPLNPDFFRALIDMIARYQERRIEILLEARPDILCDAQWYATTFLSPSLYEKFMEPALRRRADMAHASGARFCVIATTNVLPFAPILKRLGVDVLFGVDPLQGGWDLGRAKKELGDQVCLWGGVNGYLTMVDGSPKDVEQAVGEAMRALAPGGRFILAAVDNIRIDGSDTPEARQHVWRNVERLIETWRRLR